MDKEAEQVEGVEVIQGRVGHGVGLRNSTAMILN